VGFALTFVYNEVCVLCVKFCKKVFFHVVKARPYFEQFAFYLMLMLMLKKSSISRLQPTCQHK